HEKEQLSHIAKFANERDFISDTDRLNLLLRVLLESGSSLSLTLVQELLGQRDRINTPGTVGKENWTYRLPKTIEDLDRDQGVRGRLDHVRRLTQRGGRYTE